MSNVNVLLNSASIQVLDQTTLTYRVNSPIGTLTLSASAAAYDSYLNIAGGTGTILTLPVATIYAAYVKNLDPSAFLTVQVQVTAGTLQTAANSPVLSPGGVWMYWTTLDAGSGIIAMTLVSNPGNTAAEVLLAG